jgi:hypothetical protein
VPITPSEEYLAGLSAAARIDVALDRLLDLTNAGLGVEIGVVVHGAVIRGSLLPAVTFATHLDRRLDEGMAAAIENAPEEQHSGLAAAREALARAGNESLFRQGLERAERSLDEAQRLFVEGGAETLAALPDELARRYLGAQAPASAFTLRNATVELGITALDVEMIRIHTAHVGAWWVLADDSQHD